MVSPNFAVLALGFMRFDGKASGLELPKGRFLAGEALGDFAPFLETLFDGALAFCGKQPEASVTGLENLSAIDAKSGTLEDPLPHGTSAIVPPTFGGG